MLHAGQERRVAVAADGEDREAEATPLQRDPDQCQCADDPQDRRPRVRQAAGDHPLEVRRDPAARRLEDEQRQAGEGETGGQGDDDVGHTGHGDDHPGQRRQSHRDDDDGETDERARPSPRSPIQATDRQLTNTIIGPTERSMPPEITTMLWAMARKARLIVPAVIVLISKPSNLGSWETRQSSRPRTAPPPRPSTLAAGRSATARTSEWAGSSGRSPSC